MFMISILGHTYLCILFSLTIGDSSRYKGYKLEPMKSLYGIPGPSSTATQIQSSMIVPCWTSCYGKYEGIDGVATDCLTLQRKDNVTGNWQNVYKQIK